MSLRFHPDAERDLREAVDYYEDIGRGLGYDLSLRSIRRFSEPWRTREHGRFLRVKSAGLWFIGSRMECFTPRAKAHC
jgi:hypothetical protein